MIDIQSKTHFTELIISEVFRHGNRSPTELYPNDPYINHEWSGGLGALSDVKLKTKKYHFCFKLNYSTPRKDLFKC